MRLLNHRNIPCSVCGSKSFRSVYNNIPDLLYARLDKYYSYVECINCGLIYQKPRPTQAMLADLYLEDYHNTLNSNKQPASRFFLIRVVQELLVSYGLRSKSAIVNKYHKSGKILDIGCGMGDFLNEMNKTGSWKVYGVEPSAKAAEHSRKQYHIITQAKAIEDVNYPKSFFDVVTLWDVLEHLPDPADVLRKAFVWLRPGGTLIIRLPNGKSSDRRFFGRAWAGWDAPRHLYVFTPATMERLLRVMGFLTIRKTSSSGIYSSFLYSVYFNMTLRRKMKFDHWIIRVLNFPLVKLSLYPFLFIRSINLNGPEMTFVARREEAI